MQSRNPKPPRLAKWLLKRFINSDNQSTIIGDFEEIHAELHYEKGRIYSALWYWLQTLKSLPNIIFNSLLIGGFMLVSYFKLAIRNIKKYKTFSFINISGLAVSLALCLLIIKILISVYSTDTFHENADRIYRTTTTRIDNNYKQVINFATSPLPLAEKLKEYPAIDKVVRIKKNFGGNVILGDQIISISGIYADQEFLDVFSFHLDSGNRNTALQTPNSVILTNRLAVKLFGTTNVIGRSMTVGNLGEFKVTGIMEDVYKLQSSLKFECVASLSSLPALEKDDKIYCSLENWNNLNDNYIYFQTKKDASPYMLLADFPRIVKENYDNQRYSYMFELQPLSDISPGIERSNEIAMAVPFFIVVILIFFGILILITACINYTNLSIARALNRAKEIGIRKVIGANRGNIFIQFISESIALSLIALIIAYIILYLVEPYFSSINPEIRNTFNITDLDVKTVVASFLLFSLFTGVVSGFIPALYISKFKPVEILRNVMNRKIFSRVTLRKGLIVFQMFVSALFIITTLNGYTQISFLENYDYGINSENIINVSLQDVNYGTFKREIETNPSIERISASAFVPMTGVIWKEQCKLPNNVDSLDIDYLCVDENFIDNLGLTIVAGNNFFNSNPAANQHSILLNEKAVTKLGFNNPLDAVEQSIETEETGQARIIGVIKDFHYFNFDHEIDPLIISYVPKNFRYANVRVNPAGMNNTISYMEEKWKALSPSTLFSYKIYDDELHESFMGPQIMLAIVGVIAFLSILISAFGLFGMVIFDTENRIREIGIRKVMGASISDVTVILSKTFMNLLLFSFMLALPLGWFLNDLLLQEMAIHNPLSINLFIIALLGMLAVGLIIVLPKTIKAASTNPVDIIKYE